MKNKEYIESGILENYLLGIVSESERQEVEFMAKKHLEIQTELTAIEDALAIYSKQHAVPMPEGLVNKILKKVEQLEQMKSNEKNVEKPVKSFKVWATVLGLAATILTFVCIYFFNENNDLNIQLNQSQIAFDTLQTNCNETQNKLTKLENYLNITHDRNYTPIIMKGETLEKAPRAIASVFYNPTDQKAYLEIENLPEPPSDKQYQLWAIVGGVPQSMDVFDVVLGPEGLIEVPFHANAQAFAVTLEPKGGKDSPTLEEMYVIGNV